MGAYVPLPRRAGRLHYKRAADDQIWGAEDWVMTRGADGQRVLSAHCEMVFGDEAVVRDSVLAVQTDYHPHDCTVRIMNQGQVTGTGWFRITDTMAECESWTRAQGRISQTMPIARPMRGFGIHALQGDGWLSATFPFENGPGHTQHWDHSLLHSLHHFGASGPFIHRSTSGLRYVGPETITVPAGTFDCHRIQFVGMTNNHPPYDMWITCDGDFLYVKGIVQGYMDSVFELVSLEGTSLA
jgi:hypothetical protein